MHSNLTSRDKASGLHKCCTDLGITLKNQEPGWNLKTDWKDISKHREIRNVHNSSVEKINEMKPLGTPRYR
jgi:hypothetical protein